MNFQYTFSLKKLPPFLYRFIFSKLLLIKSAIIHKYIIFTDYGIVILVVVFVCDNIFDFLFAALKFQENLLRTMIQIENTYFELGKSSQKNCLIICDRGVMDASACKFFTSRCIFFLNIFPHMIRSFADISKEKWERLMAANNWNPVELRDNRYNQIVHMVSAANGAEDFYSTEDHACRSEGVVLARDLDYKAAAAWIGHPYFDVIDNSTNFETKMNRMIECICQKLGIDTGDRLLRTSRKLKFLGKTHTCVRARAAIILLLFYYFCFAVKLNV